jgi:2,3-bisphosphoglycerate-independent phosphoglycerate mutase
MNFRADRARELSRALTEKEFSGFARESFPNCDFVCLTQYAESIRAKVAFAPTPLKNVLGEVIADQNLTQLRIAETEKYAHVSFFFSGGVEAEFKGESRILIPSPNVATYDLQPEMNAPLLTEKLVAAIASKHYDLIVCNFANPDMVGHTGNFVATVKAIEAIDDCLGKIEQALVAVGGEALITADHGNAEKMQDPLSGQAHTAHTSEPVPLVYIGRNAKPSGIKGTLSDIAPTLLYLMDLDTPVEMTGKPLFILEQ